MTWGVEEVKHRKKYYWLDDCIELANGIPCEEIC